MCSFSNCLNNMQRNQIRISMKSNELPKQALATIDRQSSNSCRGADSKCKQIFWHIMCAAGAHTHLINEGRPNEGKQTSLYKLMPCTANSHTQ